jgi:cobalt-zinc-cadmium efflux system membrane fusion protein
VAKADFERAEKLHGDQIIAQKDHLRAHAEYEKAKASASRQPATSCACWG